MDCFYLDAVSISVDQLLNSFRRLELQYIVERLSASSESVAKQAYSAVHNADNRGRFPFRNDGVHFGARFIRVLMELLQPFRTFFILAEQIRNDRNLFVDRS